MSDFWGAGSPPPSIPPVGVAELSRRAVGNLAVSVLNGFAAVRTLLAAR